MKKTFLLLISFITFFTAFAQNIVTIGDHNPIPNSVLGTYYVLPDNGSTSGNSRAPQGSQRYCRSHYLIRASELATAGVPGGTAFNLIGFVYSAAQSIPTTGNLIIYMENTSDATNLKSATWGTAISTMTVVHNGSITIPSATGPFDIPFAGGSPFTYSGGGLYIAFEYSNPAGTLSTGNVALCTNVLTGGLKGAQTTTVTPPTALGTSDFRPGTRLGYTLPPNDASVTQIYTLGKLPIPFAAPHVIKANIKNSGDNPQTNLSVTLTVTGANSFSNVQVIPSLASGASVDVSFAAFNPTNTGSNNVTVSVPNDDVAGNNSASMTQIVSNNAYSYAYGTVPAGGVGLNASGDFVAKFNTNLATTINQVSVNFTSGGQPFQIGIWDATGAGGTPGNNLWTSASQTSAIGVFTLPVSPAVAVNGNFYVGVKQTGTINIGFAYQTENPIRPQTFYYTSPTGGTTWTDFSPGSPFRFMIEPRLTLANDVGPSQIIEPVAGANSICTTPIAPKAIISNYGTVNQNFNVNFKITQNGSPVYSNTQAVSITAGSSQTVTFANTFVPVSGSSYSSTVTTSLAGDGDASNDVINNAFTYTQYNYGGGGAGTGGYYFANSTSCAAGAPSKPTYNWITLTTNEVTTWTGDADDGVSAPIPIPFVFTYFGGVVTRTWVCSNGWISFTDPSALTAATLRTPVFIPTPGGIENYIAGLLEDLDLTTATYADAHVYYGTISGKLVITFDHAHQFGSATNFITFQIILDASNNITIQYNDALSTLPFPDAMRDGGVVGIENSNGSLGIMYRALATGGPIFGSPLALKFSLNAVTLPVTLSSFTAQRMGNVNNLKWMISQELNLSHYVIERSTDGLNFTTIGQVAARGLFSTSMNYQFTDNNPVKGINYYRLRIVDINNAVKYSEIRSVKNLGVTDITIAPNPVKGMAHIQVDAEKADAGSIEVLDMNGKKLYEQALSIKQGQNDVDINMSSFSKGTYVIRVNLSEAMIIRKVNKL